MYFGWRDVEPRHIRVAVRGWLMNIQISVRAKPSKPGKLNDEPKAFMIGVEYRFVSKEPCSEGRYIDFLI